MDDKSQSDSETFSTKSKKLPLRRGRFISGKRCRVFMRHLWDKNLRGKASYSTLVLEFQTFFETNDTRTIQKYLGRPEQTVRYSAISVVRMNRSSGKLANFEYHNKRQLDRKRGLLEILGYVTNLKNGS